MDLKIEYTEKLKAQLDVWAAEIIVLEAKAKQSEIGLRAKLEDAIETIKQNRAQAESTLQRILDASDDAWTVLKSGGDDAWEKVKTAIEHAKSTLLNH